MLRPDPAHERIRYMLSSILVLLVSCGGLAGQDAPAVSADAIMARVAENQDRAVKLREQYIYQQNVRIETRRTNGKLVRQEASEYLITPTPAGNEKKLQKISGKYWLKGKYVDFDGEPVPNPDSMDTEMIHDFRSDLLEQKSKDGMAKDLFPLTAEEVKKYHFTVLGEQIVDGRKTWRIGFRPADKSELTWSGEALIDEEEFQPVSVYTKLSRRIPFAVRTLLGTDLPGLGFSVRYQRVDKDTWFPVGFGTEFRLHVLFFLNREIHVSADAKNFKKATAESTIQYATP